MDHRASAEEAPVEPRGTLQVCVRCQRPLGHGFALADNGSLLEVCEGCFLVGSVGAQLRDVHDDAAREQIIRDLRDSYQLLYALRVSA